MGWLGAVLLLGTSPFAHAMALEAVDADFRPAVERVEPPALVLTPPGGFLGLQGWSEHLLQEARRQDSADALRKLRAKAAWTRELHGNRPGAHVIERALAELRQIEQSLSPSSFSARHLEEGSARDASAIWDTVKIHLRYAPRDCVHERLTAILAEPMIQKVRAPLSYLQVALLQKGAAAGLAAEVTIDGKTKNAGTFGIPLDSAEGDDRVFHIRLERPKHAPGETHAYLRVARRDPPATPAESERTVLDDLALQLREDDLRPSHDFDLVAFLRRRGVRDYRRTRDWRPGGRVIFYEINHWDGETSFLNIDVDDIRPGDGWPELVQKSYLLSRADGTMVHMRYHNEAPVNEATLAEQRRQAERQ